MLNANLWQALMTLPFVFLPVLQGGKDEVSELLAFAERHPEVYLRMAIFAGTMAVGNLFIYELQRQSGAVVVTLTTTLRKFFTVLLSSLPPPIGFGNKIMPLQYVGAILVFSSRILTRRLCGGGGQKQQGQEKKTN